MPILVVTEMHQRTGRLQHFLRSSLLIAAMAPPAQADHIIDLMLIVPDSAPVDGITLFGANDPDPGDRFGAAVARVGGRILVGAPNEDGPAPSRGSENSLAGAGAAYDFRSFSSPVSSGWGQIDYLKSPDPREGGAFGSVVAAGGGYLAVSEPGHYEPGLGTRGAVHLYRIDGGGSHYLATVVIPEAEAGQFGVALAMSANTGLLLVGTSVDAAYIFRETDDVWEEEARLSGPPNSGFASRGLAIEGANVLVGAPQEGAGLVYAYALEGAGWVLKQRLAPTNPEPGDEFGTSIAIHGFSGGAAIIGAPGEDGSATVIDGNGADNRLPDAGAAFAFLYRDGTWRQDAYLKPSVINNGDRFGSSVALARGSYVDSVGWIPRVAIVTGTAGAQVFARDIGLDGRWRQGERIISSTGGDTLFPVSGNLAGNLVLGFEKGNAGAGSVGTFAIDPDTTSPEQVRVVRADPASALHGEDSGGTEEPSSAEGGSGTGTNVGDWTLAVDPTVSEWQTMNYVQRVGGAINNDLVNLGGSWFWGTSGTYFYVEEPFIWNDSFKTWFYVEFDDSGAYLYNFTGDSWDWRSRDGELSSRL